MKIKSKTNLKQKEGISLIVLVITIIVMIILAAAVIISLSNNGIIAKANEAVEKTDEKQMQILAGTLWADAYMIGKRDNELITSVETGLEAVDENYKSKYVVNITNTGVSLEKAEWEVLYDGGETTQEGMLIVSQDAAIFDNNSKYRITVESDYYIGTFETEYIPEIEGMYCLGFLQEDNTVRYLLPIEFVAMFTGNEQYYPENCIGSIVIAYNEEETSIIGINPIGMEQAYDYKVKKIERLKNNIVNDLDKANEYGFLYNTWYTTCMGGTGFFSEINVFFKPDNALYFYGAWNTDAGLEVCGAGTWSVAEDGRIVMSLDEIGYTYVVVGQDMLLTADALLGTSDIDEHVIPLINFGKTLEIRKNENGIYQNGIYVTKDVAKFKQMIEGKYNQTIGDDEVTLGYLSYDNADTSITHSYQIQDENQVISTIQIERAEIVSTNYTVSEDGKTIIEKYGDIEIEYVLIEDGFKFVD